MTDKPIYAPIPARAMLDERLAARHWRTLAVVAAHDRLGANGIGCYASHSRLCKLVGCDYSRLSVNLKELGEWGYIERHIHPLNKKLRVYRIIYTEEDGASLKGIKDSLPDGKAPPPDSLPTRSTKPAENCEKPALNIFREAENISCETKKYIPLKRVDGGDLSNSGETDRAGQFLRETSERIRQGCLQGESVEGLRSLEGRLWETAEALEAETPSSGTDAGLYHWAMSLIVDVGQELDRRT